MAIVEVDGWWVYALESGEVSHHENEADAIASAHSRIYPGYPSMVLSGKFYKFEED